MLASFRNHTEFNVARTPTPSSIELTLAIALRCSVILVAVGAAASVSADEAPTGKPLAGAQRFQQQSGAGASGDARDEASFLTRQLESFGTWSAIEPLPEASSDIRKATTKSTDYQNAISLPPLLIPGLIDRPDRPNGIDDENVNPIPTRPNAIVEGSAPEAVTTTIPVVPDPRDGVAGPLVKNSGSAKESRSPDRALDSQANIYDSAPRLLPDSAESSADTMPTPDDNQASVWELAAARLISNFTGVLLAVGLFLLIRIAAVQVFGVNLGVTFQFGKTSKPSAETMPENEVADVVPFNMQASQTEASSQQPAPEHASSVAEPADFTFRIIGSANGDDDSASEGSSDQQPEASILKSVFDQNVKLLKELDKRNESAA
jgi:hypothetical protein